MELKYAYDITMLCVCVCHIFQLLNQLNDFHETWWYVVSYQLSYFLSFYNPK